MTLVDLNKLFGPDERCREIMERLRWPEGVICPRCKHKGTSWLQTYSRYECNACTYCLAPDCLDTELSVFMQRLRMQGVAGEPGLV